MTSHHPAASAARPQIHSVDIADLTAEPIARDQRPVLVTGLRATSEPWSPDVIAERVGSTSVPVTEITGGEYMSANHRTMTIREYLEAIAEPEPGAPIPYLAELSYDEYFPGLATELVDPPEMPGERFALRVMYLGRLVHSQTHFHTAGSAMLFCLHGSKVVRLFAPDQTDRMYKVERRNFSEVLITSLGDEPPEYDRDRFPRFADAEYTEVVVRAGDVLYIPIHWWHSIQNIDEVSLTAVYFWTQTWRDSWRLLVPPRLPPRGLRSDYWWDLLSRARRHPGDLAVNPHRSGDRVTTYRQEVRSRACPAASRRRS